MSVHRTKSRIPTPMRLCLCAALTLLAPLAHANAATLSKQAQQAGGAIGSAAYKVGQTGKRIGLAVGHEGKRVGLDIGHAAKSGGLAFWHAVKGEKE